MADAVAQRRAERERLIELARSYVERLSSRIPVRAAAVVGSVARGDFNVWSDVDVVVVSDELPTRAPDRGALLAADAPAGIQPAGFTREEFRAAVRTGSRLARSVAEEGVILLGDEFLRA